LKDLETIFSRLTTYKDYIMDVHKSTGWPLPILYGMTFRESESRHDAYSPGGDAGLWQISYATGKDLGLIRGKKDYRFDPKESSEKIKVLLNELNSIYGNKHHLKIAAYNQGPNRTSRNIIEGRPWTPHVRDHVVTIMAAAYINAFHNNYGISIRKMPLYSEKLKEAYPVKIETTKTLGDLARKYGKPESEIAFLNPVILNPQNTRSLIAAGQYIKLPK